MIHWLIPAEKTTRRDPTTVTSFVAAEGDHIADIAAFRADSRRLGNLWVWVNPYLDDVKGVRSISWAASPEDAATERRHQLDDI